MDCMITITPNHARQPVPHAACQPARQPARQAARKQGAPILFAATSRRLGAAHRYAVTILRRLATAPQRTPTPSERAIDELQDVDTLRRW